MKNKKVTASSIANSIIGTYEGEVLNPNITNKNGLDITMDVMETVLDDYVKYFLEIFGETMHKLFSIYLCMFAKKEIIPTGIANPSL